MPPPPRSTLFPYTTLFRSFQDYVFYPYLMGDQSHIHPLLIIFGLLAGEKLDRKSTRLNSSHVSISYAVFCLKKKKKKKKTKTKNHIHKHNPQLYYHTHHRV